MVQTESNAQRLTIWQKIGYGLSVAGAILQYAIWMPYAIVFLGLLIDRPGWILKILPPIGQITLYAWFASIPFLLLVLIPKTRIIGGSGFTLLSSLFGVGLICESAIVVFSVWGKVGLVIGTLLIGIGIVPEAIVSALLRFAWPLFWILLMNATTVLLAKYAGYGVLMTSVQSDISEDTEERQAAKRLMPLSVAGCVAVVLIGVGQAIFGYYHPNFFNQ